MLKHNKPRHEQISDWLREQISEGHFKVGDQLPSESELSEQFDVSRVTVRHALKTLESEGAIYRRQGLGSFVDEAEVDQPMVCLTDFDEDMKRAGMQSGSKIIRRDLDESDTNIAEKLELETGCKVVRLDRVRLADDQPVAFDMTWLPIFYGQLLEGHNLEEQTIYTILEEQYDIPILKGRYTINAVNANEYLAEHLGVAPRDALLLIDRISLTTGDKKIYYQRRFYRPDRIRYEVELERRDAKDCELKRGLPLKRFAPVFTE